jgi:hypothetical protein
MPVRDIFYRAISILYPSLKRLHGSARSTPACKPIKYLVCGVNKITADNYLEIGLKLVKNILAKDAGWLLLHFWKRPESG